MKWLVLTLMVLGLTFSSTSCKRKRAKINGIGEWVIGKTTLASSQCLSAKDGELSWCTNNHGVGIGHQTATVDLYFRGHQDNAPLIEIHLAIRGCQVEQARAALVEILEEPHVSVDLTLFWDETKAVVVARLPARHGLCLIHFVAPTEK